MRFEGKTAIVTAAGAGIGRATTDILVREGARVVAVEIDPARLDKMAEELGDAAGEVDGRCMDAMNETQVRDLVSAVETAHGHVDLLVNAVGGSTIIDDSGATVDELTFAEWQKLIDFNLSATFLFCNAAVPGMKSAGGGKIVNLASIAGRGLSASSSSARAWAVWHQRECDCAEPHPDRTPAAALGEAQRRRPGRGDRKGAVETDRDGARPGRRRRIPVVQRRGLRHRTHH